MRFLLAICSMIKQYAVERLFCFQNSPGVSGKGRIVFLRGVFVSLP